MTTTVFDVSVMDIVRLSNGHEFIVTSISPKRPANPFSGVKVNGQGTEYKFDPKWKPVVIGKADTSHPAILTLQARKHRPFTGFLNNSMPSTASGPFPQPSNDAVAVVCHLLDAVEADDQPKAKILAAALRTMPQFRKPS